MFRSLNSMKTFEAHTKLHFGQYKGLTVQQVYQGTLRIDDELLADYIRMILDGTSMEFNFIETIQVEIGRFRINGEIHDPEQPLSDANRVYNGNLEENLSHYINRFSHPNSLGILTTIQKFNSERKRPTVIGGDPEYLNWCERNIEGFRLTDHCKAYLQSLSVCRFERIDLVYLGDGWYEYSPCIKVIPPLKPEI